MRPQQAGNTGAPEKQKESTCNIVRTKPPCQLSQHLSPLRGHCVSPQDKQRNGVESVSSLVMQLSPCVTGFFCFLLLPLGVHLLSYLPSYASTYIYLNEIRTVFLF